MDALTIRESIAELEFEIDTHRILWSQYVAMGREDLAAHEDEQVRYLTDELNYWYGTEELGREAA